MAHRDVDDGVLGLLGGDVLVTAVVVLEGAAEQVGVALFAHDSEERKKRRKHEKCISQRAAHQRRSRAICGRPKAKWNPMQLKEQKMQLLV